MTAMIKSVRLYNWRSHKETALEFSKGTNMLVGIMGSGKSSVLEAMCFAFYGTFPALARRRVKLGQIVSNNSSGTSARIEVVVEKEGKEYTFIRTIKDGKGDAELREGGKLIDVKSDAVTRMAEHILGVDYDLFTKAVYAEQNSLDYFLSLNPTDRKKQIDELIGIDRFELARTNATKLANRLSKEAEEKAKLLDAYDKTQLLDEKRAGDERLASVKSDIETLKHDMKLTEQEYAAFRQEHDILERKRSAFEELSRKEIECRTFVDEMGKNIKGHKREHLESERRAIDALESETKTLKEKITMLDSAKSALEREIGELKGIIKMAESKRDEYAQVNERIAQVGEAGNVDEIKKEAESLSNETREVDKKLSVKKREWELVVDECKKLKEEIERGSVLEKELAGLKGMTQRVLDEKRQLEENTRSWGASLREIIKISQEYIERLNEEGGGVCPLCESPLDAKKKAQLISNKKEIIENSRKELEKSERQLSQLSAEAREVEAGIHRRAEIEKELEELGTKRKRLVEGETRAGTLSDECRDLEHALAELTQKQSVVNARLKKAEEADSLKKRLDEIGKFLEENRDAGDKLREATVRYESLEKELRAGQERFSECERELVSKTSLVKEIERDIELQARVDEKRGEMLRIGEEIKRMDYKEDVLRRITESLNQATVRKREIEVKLANANDGLPQLERNIELVSKQLAEIEKRENEIKKRHIAVKNLSEFQQAVVETQAVLRSELVNSINAVMERVWGILYPYGDIEKVRLDATESDYVLMASRRGEWIAVEGNVSGGERASAALALRVALSIVLAPQMSMLILDEPTHNLDENGVKSLCEILKEKLPKIISQSFVITHDEVLKEGASGRLYTFHRDKKIHGPTQIAVDSI